MTIKNVNWCGGFNRIFVLLCIGWVVFVLYEPTYDGRNFATKNYAFQLEQADENYRHDGDEIKWKKAESDADATFQRLWNYANFSNSLKEVEHDPKIIMFIILIPAVFYFFVIGAVWLVRWIADGFRGKAEDIKA